MGVLRGLVAPDADWLCAEAEGAERTRRWTAQGQSLSPPVVNMLLADGVRAQAVGAHADGTPVALFQLTQGRGSADEGQLDLVVAPGAGAQRAGVEAFLAAVAADQPLRRVWVEVVDGDLDVELHLPPATLAARLREHERAGVDSYRDVLVYEVAGAGGGAP